MAINEPFHIKHTLPPSFRAWYQFLKRTEDSLRGRPQEEVKIIVWYETHPTGGLRQGYEFTLDEIKARVFDEMRRGLESILTAAGAASDDGQRRSTLEELYRFISYRYFQKP
jgi:hypothetical protein